MAGKPSRLVAVKVKSTDTHPLLKVVTWEARLVT